MAQMMVTLEKAPESPLNLQFGVVYAPRVEAPPFVGFEAVQVGPDVYIVRAYDAEGVAREVFRDSLLPVYWRFAQHLRMDVAP